MGTRTRYRSASVLETRVGGPERPGVEGRGQRSWAGRDFDLRAPLGRRKGVDNRSHSVDHSPRHLDDDTGFGGADNRKIGGIAAIDHPGVEEIKIVFIEFRSSDFGVQRQKPGEAVDFGNSRSAEINPALSAISAACWDRKHAIRGATSVTPRMARAAARSSCARRSQRLAGGSDGGSPLIDHDAVIRRLILSGPDHQPIAFKVLGAGDEQVSRDIDLSCGSPKLDHKFPTSVRGCLVQDHQKVEI